MHDLDQVDPEIPKSDWESHDESDDESSDGGKTVRHGNIKGVTKKMAKVRFNDEIEPMQQNSGPAKQQN